MAAHRRMAVVVALACAACADLGGESKPPPAAHGPTVQGEPAIAKPAAPSRSASKEAAKESAPAPAPEPGPSKGAQLVAQAIKSYEDGDYRSASVQLSAALHESLTASERASAHKYLAFIACANNRAAACREEFRKAFAADPAFDLTPAEAGHPTWGPAFKRVKNELAAGAKRKRAP